MNDKNLQKLKPFLPELIEYYREVLGFQDGGNLHIILDDGNTSHTHVWHCQQNCANNDDTLGSLITHLMRLYTEDELNDMYERDWKHE